MTVSATDVQNVLGLKPHPTCGFVRETYPSTTIIPQASLPPFFNGPRPVGSALYFMVTATAHIAMHRILSDQMYQHHAGDPLEVLLLYPDGTSEVRLAGPTLAAGMRPELLIPARTFHMSRIKATSGYALLGTTEWPGVQAPDDVERGDRDRLVAAYPAIAETIRSFMDHAPATVLPRGP